MMLPPSIFCRRIASIPSGRMLSTVRGLSRPQTIRLMPGCHIVRFRHAWGALRFAHRSSLSGWPTCEGAPL
jgi:hypothetical protein